MKKTDQDYKKDQNTYNALTQNLKKLEVSQASALLQIWDVKAGLQQKYVRVCWTEWDVRTG